MWKEEVAANVRLEGTGICPMLGYGESSDYCYILLAFAAGGDLSEVWRTVDEDDRMIAALQVMM